METPGHHPNVLPLVDCFVLPTAPLPSCEGGVDVVGVITPLRGGAQVVLHGDQIVELSLCSGCMRKEKWKRTGEGHVEVETEEVEVKEKRTWMTMRMT